MSLATCALDAEIPLQSIARSLVQIDTCRLNLRTANRGRTKHIEVLEARNKVVAVQCLRDITRQTCRKTEEQD